MEQRSQAGAVETGPDLGVLASAWRPCSSAAQSVLQGAGHFLALRARALLAALPGEAEDEALIRIGVAPDLELCLRLRQRKRRALAAAAQAGRPGHD